MSLGCPVFPTQFRAIPTPPPGRPSAGRAPPRDHRSDSPRADHQFHDCADAPQLGRLLLPRRESAPSVLLDFRTRARPVSLPPAQRTSAACPLPFPRALASPLRARLEKLGSTQAPLTRDRAPVHKPFATAPEFPLPRATSNRVPKPHEKDAAPLRVP